MMTKKNNPSRELKEESLNKTEPKNGKGGKGSLPKPQEQIFSRSSSGATSPKTTAASPYQANGTSSIQKKGPVTRILIKYDAGFSNNLFIRGKGANLNWDKGLPLRNLNTDEWVWETETSFTSCEFKILINDSIYEVGDNHLLPCGASIQYSPKFP